MLAPLSAHNTGRIDTQASISATLLQYARDLYHRVGNGRRLIAKSSADARGKCFASIKEAVGTEGLWEHTDVLEVDNADSVRVEEEVLLLDVGVVDVILPERGQELLRLHLSWKLPRTSPAAPIPLCDRKGSISGHENGQVRDSNL